MSGAVISGGVASAPVADGNSPAREAAARLAKQIVGTVTARGANYGTPEANFTNIADLWRVYLRARFNVDLPLDAAAVGSMSALIKVARLAQSPGHEDSALDGAVYLMLGYGCVSAAQNGDV